MRCVESIITVYSYWVHFNITIFSWWCIGFSENQNYFQHFQLSCHWQSQLFRFFLFLKKIKVISASIVNSHFTFQLKCQTTVYSAFGNFYFCFFCCFIFIHNSFFCVNTIFICRLSPFSFSRNDHFSHCLFGLQSKLKRLKFQFIVSFIINSHYIINCINISCKYFDSISNFYFLIFIFSLLIGCWYSGDLIRHLIQNTSQTLLYCCANFFGDRISKSRVYSLPLSKLLKIHKFPIIIFSITLQLIGFTISLLLLLQILSIYLPFNVT